MQVGLWCCFLGPALFLPLELSFAGHPIRNGDLGTEIGRPHFQNKGNPHHVLEGDREFAAFDPAHVMPVEVAQFS